MGGTGEITGNFSRDQAVDLSVKLNAGALPVPIKILEERTIGATLGQDSIEKESDRRSCRNRRSYGFHGFDLADCLE